MKTKNILLGSFIHASLFSLSISMVVSCGQVSTHDWERLNDMESLEDQAATEDTSGVKNLDDGVKDAWGIKIFSGVGSSSITPIMDVTKKGFFKSMDYNPEGSGEGYKVGLSNTEKLLFGTTSSKKIPSDDDLEKWNTNNSRTITFATDAIAIVANIPNDIKLNLDQNGKEERPIINMVELTKLYDYESTNETQTSTTWEKLLVNVDKDKSTEKALNISPIAIGRDGGKKKSGTAEAFWYTLENYLPDGVKADYNHETLVKHGGQTSAEANSAAMTFLKAKKGSITYLSLGYAATNQDGNMVMTSLQIDDDTTWVPGIKNIMANKYSWIRPFNVIYDSSSKNAQVFAQYLLSNDGQRVVGANNFIPLKAEQIKLQAGAGTNESNFGDSDEKANTIDGIEYGLY